MNRDLGPVILRVALALVFLSFSIMQLWSPENWASYVPSFLIKGILTPVILVLTNAYLEMIFGTLLLFGLYTRLSSLILGLHLIGITLSVGFNAVGVRDFGLAFATLSLFFTGAPHWSLDAYFEQKHERSQHMTAPHLAHSA